jgi:type II secretory pathway pseudopilin PulG
MTFTPQGTIVALLLAFLLGVILGYYAVQNRLRRQTVILMENQRRLAELEQSHEARLREATERLRTDYETELATTIEHYQDQLSQKTLELEQAYETRFRVLQQGALSSPSLQPIGVGSGITPVPDIPTQSYISGEPLGVPPEPATPFTPPADALRLKRQYEMRLKEAAQKLQKAYEKQLAQHVKTARLNLQTEYEQQWNLKLQEQREHLVAYKAQLQAEFNARKASVYPIDTMAEDFAEPLPPEARTSEPQVADFPGRVLPQRPPSPQYTQNEIDARIREVAEELQREYDAQLARKLETYEVQVLQRLADLEKEYEERLANFASQTVIVGSSTQDILKLDPVVDASSVPSPVVSAEAVLQEEFLEDLENAFEDEAQEDGGDFGDLDLSDFNQLT